MDDQMNQNGNGQGGGNQGGTGNQNPRKVNFFLLLLAALCTLILTSVFMKTVSGSTTEQKSYSEFMDWVEEGRVEGQPVRRRKHGSSTYPAPSGKTRI